MNTHYQQAIDRCQDAILLVDEKSRIIGSNRSLQQQFKLSNNQLQQSSLFELITPADPLTDKTNLTRLISDSLSSYSNHNCALLTSVQQRSLYQCCLTPAMQEDGSLLCELRLSPSDKEQQNLHLALTEKNWQLQQIIDAVPHMIYVKDSEGRFIVTNKALAAHYGKEPEQLGGLKLEDLHRPFSEEESSKLARDNQKLIKQQQFKHISEEQLTNFSGDTLLLESYKVPFRLRDENGLLCVSVDITEQQFNKRQLESVNYRLEAITATIPDLGFVLDEDGHYQEVFGAPKSLLFDDENKLYGKSVRDVLPADVAEKVMNAIKLTLETDQPQIIEYQLQVPAGNKCFEARTSRLLQLEGEKPSIICIARDISERKEAETQTHYLAYHDSLTGLPNRALLKDRIEHALSRARRENNIAAVLFIDLDHFKNINDSLGHAVGDQLLKQVAQRIPTSIREVDTVGRLGGDEFVVVLSDIGNDIKSARENTRKLAAKIRDDLSRPFSYGGHELLIAASIGVVTFPSKYVNAEEILSHADTAMYDAKSKGRDNLVFFAPEMATIVKRRLTIENDLRKALDQNQLHIHYQPKVSVKSGKITGAECLLRWNHPQWGAVSPVEFIPIMETTGLILPIGEWVIEHTTAQLRNWIQQGLWKQNQKLSINISPRQFIHTDFFQALLRLVEKSGAPITCIDLEITEGMVIHNLEDTVRKMEKIRSQGFSFSIDDFGTGYSSLTYLKRLPLDTLKIDREFIRDLTDDPDDAAIVDTILTMAKRFQLEVVAEGVETTAQLEFLRERECGQCQGFLLSKPLAAEHFEELLLAHNTSNNLQGLHSAKGAPTEQRLDKQ